MFSPKHLGLLALAAVLSAGLHAEEATATQSAPAETAPVEASAAGHGTTVHGYVTTDFQGGVLINDATGKNQIVPNFEQYRFVFGFASPLGADWHFNSEVEFEHATRVGVKTDSTTGKVSAGLEVEIEQAYVENRRWEWLQPRVGVILAPIGRLNLNHDADTVASVDRPISDQQIMPTTWYEPGLGLTGQIELGPVSLGYEAYAVNGLRGTTTSAGAEGSLRDVRMSKDSANDNNTDKALVGRLALGLGSNAELGVSGYRGSYDPSSSLYFTFTALDGIVKWRWFELQGEWVSVGVDKPAGAPATFASLRQGWYGQALASLPTDDWGTFQPYVQVSQIDPNVSVLTKLDQTRTTYGLNYRPVDNVVFKAAYGDTDYYLHYTDAAGNRARVLDQRLMASAAWGF